MIEAAPELIELKRGLFEGLAAVVGEDCVIASNTSSIPITQLAAMVPAPARFVGMHFFNPAPVMRLVEVIAGVQTGEPALLTARATGEAMGKHVIDAADGPGFLVNRCGRPFGLEALRVVQERIADVETVDRIVRLGGGFRMGPFELQDLVGIDTGFEVSRSFFELSFGEPRWRPSPLSARMVASGRHGRKTGRGWYEYESGEIVRAAEPPAPAPGGGDGRLVVIGGDLTVVANLRELALDAGWDVREPDEASGEVPFLIVDCGGAHGEDPLQGGPVTLLCADGSLAALDGGGPSAGFHALPPLAVGGLVELTRSTGTSAAAAERSEQFFASLGLHAAWSGDAPGLVLGRHRLPARQRGRVRRRRGGRQPTRHRRRNGTRAQPPARAARLGRPDRPRSRDRGARRAASGARRPRLPRRPAAAPPDARGAARRRRRRRLPRLRQRIDAAPPTSRAPPPLRSTDR